MDQDERLERIETRLDSIDENLARHMRRSDALEAQMEPMKAMMNEVKGVAKFLKLIGIIAAIAEAIRMFYH